jgi:hypothetical protein
MVLYEALSSEEQDAAAERLHRKRAVAQAQEDTVTAKMLRSLLRVAEVEGAPPTYERYRAIQRQLADEGEDIVPAHKLIRHFGSWRLAREALNLSEVSTADAIDERFRKRQLDRMWRYTEAELSQALSQAVEHYWRAPTVAEFEWWRRRQLALAAAEGNNGFHLPGRQVYWRRYGPWDKVLAHFGHQP